MFTARKNERSKNALIAKARELKNDYDTPGNIAERLEDFVNQLQNQEKTKSRKVANVDEELNIVLDDIKAACKSGNTAEAEGLCDALFSRADLRPAKAKKKSKKVIYTSEEILKNMIAKLEGKSKNLQQQEAAVSAKLKRDPYNAAFAAELTNVRADLKAAQNQLAMLLDQTNRKAIMRGIEMTGETEKLILADQDASDENFQHALNKFSDIMSRAEDRADATQMGADAYFGSTAGGTASVMTGVQRRNYAEEAGIAGNASGRVNYAAAAGLTSAAAGAGASDGQAANLESTFAALDKTIDELTLVDKYYSYKIDDAKANFEKNKEAIRELLKKRETASAIDCVSLDGDIDKISIDLDIAEKAIENFASARALNSERLKLAQRAKVEKDISAASQLVVGGQEFIETSPDIAMYVKNATESRNDEINDAGAINAVADSTQAQTTSVSGGRAYGDSTSRTKDEDKYNDLKTRFGL